MMGQETVIDANWSPPITLGMPHQAACGPRPCAARSLGADIALMTFQTQLLVGFAVAMVLLQTLHMPCEVIFPGVCLSRSRTVHVWASK